MNPRWATLCELARLPNVVMAPADVIAGACAAGSLADGLGAVEAARLIALCLASMHLYAGGMMLNDVCDAEADALRRPQRPIPSGRVQRAAAARIAGGLLLAGVVCAWAASSAAGLMAMALATCAALYDGPFKSTPLAPPLMGLCRALNFALGGFVGSHGPAWLADMGPTAFCLLVYVAALTAFARKETQEGHRTRLTFGLAGMVIGALGVAAIITFAQSPADSSFVTHAASVALALLVAALLLRVGASAVREASPLFVQSAVRIGVFGILIMQAAIALGAAGWLPMGVILLLGALSLWASQRMPMT